MSTKESEKQNLSKIIRAYKDQVTDLGKRFDSSCELEVRLNELQKRRTKEEALVTHFEDNNEAYVKITKTIENKAHSILLDKKALLRLALLSLTDSMRNDPEKFSFSIYFDTAAYYNRKQGLHRYATRGSRETLYNDSEGHCGRNITY
jgi:hypothetical protein